MARSKSTTTGKTTRKTKGSPIEEPIAASVSPVNPPDSDTSATAPATAAEAVVSASKVAAESNVASESQVEPEAKAVPQPRRLGVVKSETRKKIVVPINLEDEIRRRAYEIYQQRGAAPGNPAEDWLAAEREVRQRYQQQTA